MTRRGGRISAGKVAVWKHALSSLWQYRVAWLVATALMIGSTALLVALLGASDFSNGYMIGFAVAAVLFFALLVAFVPNGGASRFMGTTAEEWTGDTLRKHHSVWNTIPSLKFGKHDIDHVALCPGGVLAVETKWTQHAPSAECIAAWANGIAQDARTLRHQINATGRKHEIPENMFRAALVIWQTQPRTVSLHTVATGNGDVAVMSGGELDGWLSELGTGRLGQDYAEQLARDLDALARQRDRTAIEAGRVVRLLARTR